MSSEFDEENVPSEAIPLEVIQRTISLWSFLYAHEAYVGITTRWDERCIRGTISQCQPRYWGWNGMALFQVSMDNTYSVGVESYNDCQPIHTMQIKEIPIRGTFVTTEDKLESGCDSRGHLAASKNAIHLKNVEPVETGKEVFVRCWSYARHPWLEHRETR